jgi:hypothetical protein
MSTEQETSAEATKPAKEPRVPKRGVGTVVKEAIVAGKTNEEALAAALAEFPEARTTASTISWYRNNLRKSGIEIPTARELKKKAAPEAADPLA